ncbi:MAG: LbtU family siderophore porin [Deltaproteobacteria bacterium]|nr:MAG: LbtU family siderophore porin [Deltaproteobacteria bacterium]
MKTHNLIVIGATLCVALFPASLNAQALDKEALKAEIKEELKQELWGGWGAGIQDRIQLSGLIEFGGAWQDVTYRDGTGLDQSDLALTTVELTAEAEVNDWTNVAITLLYEDATFGDETSVDLDTAALSVRNTEGFPVYLSAGAMYVPFGALLTHFPDDPLMDVPLTLLLGETREKALLVGVEHGGLSLSGYLFNGDMDETGQENHIEGYGLDANYSCGDEEVWDILVGISYISNIADSDGLEGALKDRGVNTIEEYIGGFDIYLHVGYGDFFFDVEYMAATDDFKPAELATDGQGARPAVWNFEFGYNLAWAGNLEIALKYAGSDESGALGFPKERYGIALNQEILEGAIVSLAYLNDDYEDDDIHGRDNRDVVYGQVAIAF